MTMTRRELVGTLIGAAALAACGGDSGSSADAASIGNCLANGTSVNIAANHGHVLVVSKADVMAGTDKTYDITGSATHAHSVTITAALFAKLAQNMTASTVSTVGNAHTHDILVMCA